MNESEPKPKSNGKKSKHFKQKALELQILLQPEDNLPKTKPEELQVQESEPFDDKAVPRDTSKFVNVEKGDLRRFVFSSGENTGIPVSADTEDDDWEFEDIPYRLVMNKPMPRS